MKARLCNIILLVLLLFTVLISSDVHAVPLPQQSITIQSANFTGPDAQGAYTVEGSYVASGFDPNADTSISIYMVFIDDTGVWPGVYESYSIADKCETLNGACVDKAYVNGDTVGSATIHNGILIESEDGASIDFAGSFTPPAGATQMRLYGFFNQVVNGNPWPAFFYRFDLLDPMPVLAPQPTQQGQPTPTPSPTPPAGPCTIIVSPASASVNVGGEVSFAGAAIWSSGVPMSGALLNIDCGGLDGSGCVSPSRTDAAGNFSFTYAAPPNTNQASSVTLQVSVEGCPVVKNVPVTITGGSASSGPVPGICPSPAISAAFLFGMILLQTRKNAARKGDPEEIQ